MKIAIIGCGLIGAKRTRALGKHKLVIAADTDIHKAESICSIADCGAATDNWREAAMHPEADIVVVATTNNWLTPIGLFALEHNKHVLVEKPGARSAREIEPFVKRAKSSDRKVKVGFNLRYHPAIVKAKDIIDSGGMGELMFLRGRYGHGGRIGYDKEWRAAPEVSGGGELIDQGVHLIDLSRWFLGDIEHVDGFVHTYFWDMPVDDNGFVSLRTRKNQMAWLHASCTEWKNMFCLEIYGKEAKLQIDGLGGSYGAERLSYYKMMPEMGPPETTIWEYPGEDRSWQNEFDDFVDCIVSNKPLNGGLNDAYKALVVVDKVYAGKYNR